jgi:hypothetical protein
MIFESTARSWIGRKKNGSRKLFSQTIAIDMSVIRKFVRTPITTSSAFPSLTWHLLDIKPEGGNFICSSCEALNEEMEIDFRRLWHWLKRFNINSCGFSLDEKGSPFFEKCYHASCHASGRTSLGSSSRSTRITLCRFILRRGIGLKEGLRM